VAGAGLPVLGGLSPTDYAEGVYSPAEAAVVGRWSMEHGADLVDVSSGGIIAHPVIDYRPGYQVPFAETVRAGGQVPTAAVGLITSGAQAEGILASGAADAVFAGREWLRDPHFALRAAQELGAQSEWPAPSLRAR
jgi:2,4-dienoyl-CoA reductase-like NADH-dependent reductase (Old Yellow Enzyme family)